MPRSCARYISRSSGPNRPMSDGTVLKFYWNRTEQQDIHAPAPSSGELLQHWSGWRSAAALTRIRNI
jgi:hypothetical protein